LRKLINSADLAKIVEDGDTVTGTGFSFMAPEELFIALEESFLATGHPRDLTIMAPGGAGNLRGKGFDHFAHEGFVKKVIIPYFNLTPALQKLILEEKIEAYMLPAGVMAQLLRDIGAKRPGLITHVGLGTFADPRLEGCSLNKRSKEVMTEIIEIDGKEYLRYKPIHIDVALVKVTTADEYGNCTMEKEPAFLTTLPMAIATHNCGGKVIVQAERVAALGTLHPQRVLIPGILVDGVVIARPENHRMTWREQYNPARSGETRTADYNLPPVEMCPEKIVARRAIYELEPGDVVNLGAGMPEYISSVSLEEGIFDKIVLTVEAGMIGGIPGYGLQFNTASNPFAILDQACQMDLYDGGGNDASCVGFAQIDQQGNVNVSKLESKIPGVGGFLNVFPMSKKRVHCGAFTAGKSNIEVKNGKLHIIEDGNIIKFVKKVDQITVSGSYINNFTVPTVIITERAVFHYTNDGKFILTEIAPGVDLHKDILEKMDFQPIISENLKSMPPEIFEERTLNLGNKEPWSGFTMQG
jgi:propionate CoA-transferase